MTDREKLIALMTEAAHEWGCKINNYEHHLVDHLIANGVVVREWIPVTERLPEQYESVIVWTMYGEMGEAEHDGKRFIWAYDNDVAAATHWMPMPEPPMRKGENDG